MEVCYERGGLEETGEVGCASGTVSVQVLSQDHGQADGADELRSHQDYAQVPDGFLGKNLFVIEGW